MPYIPPPPPSASTRLWSSEVDRVDAQEGVDPLAKDPTYVFNNGRKFVERAPYEPPDLPPVPVP